MSILYSFVHENYLAWSDYCVPKEEGGLGIRDLFEWNRYAILFQIWRVSKQDKESIWILWVHNCLMKNKAFWTAKIPYKCSWCVRKLLNHRNEARVFLRYKISPSSSVILWNDPWLQSSPLIDTLRTTLISALNSTSKALVSSIVSNGAWDIGSSNHTLAIEFRRLLSSFRIHSSDSVS